MLKVGLRSNVDTERVQREFQKAIYQSLGQTGMKMLNDIVEVTPKPPIDTGNLRGSGFVIVDDKTILGNANERTGENTVLVGLDTEYAARQHELPAPYKSHKKPQANAGSGPKFVESKVVRFYNKYAEFFAAKVKEKIDALTR